MQKNELLRFKTGTDKLYGIYRGVVEDRDDPLLMGRVRVRIWGVHTEEQEGDLNKAPYDELQWAQPINGNLEGSISDCGAFCVPVKGSHVMVFFENGNMMQPRYFGTVPGWPVDAAKYSQLEKQDGFRDPTEEYPLDDHIPEQDWNRLARKENLAETYLTIKELNLDLGVGIAFGGEWDEQPPMYEAIYPNNNVFATHEEYDKNQVFEFDSTDGAQRLQYWHPSMSYFEINKDGRMVLRNAHNRWDICDEMKMQHTMSDNHKMVQGNLTTLIDLEEWREVTLNRWTRIDIDDWRQVIGDSYKWVKGAETNFLETDRYMVIGIDFKEIVVGDKESVIEGDLKKWISGDYEENIDGKYILAVWSDMERVIDANDSKYVVNDIIHQTEGNWNASSDNYMILNAPDIEIGNGVVNIGPTVNLGVDPLDALTPDAPTPVKPVAPSLPPDPPTPPSPPDPPEFIPDPNEVDKPEPKPCV